MAKKYSKRTGKQRFGLNFDHFLEFASTIDERYGEQALRQATGNALHATKDYVTAEIKKAMDTGKYNFDRTGKTRSALAENTRVHWAGTVATIKVGFNLPEGINAIFLAYGTPHIKPDIKLRQAMRGEGKHREAISDIQMTEFEEVMLQRSGYYNE